MFKGQSANNLCRRGHDSYTELFDTTRKKPIQSWGKWTISTLESQMNRQENWQMKQISTCGKWRNHQAIQGLDPVVTQGSPREKAETPSHAEMMKPRDIQSPLCQQIASLGFVKWISRHRMWNFDHWNQALGCEIFQFAGSARRRIDINGAHC